MEEKIEYYTNEDIKKFHEIKGTPNLQLQADVKKAYGEAEIQLFDKTLDFTYKILTTIGLVAGFGFTAISKVITIYLFVFGEGLLLSAILLGIFWVQKIYLSNLKSVQKTSSLHSKLFNARNIIYRRIFDRLMKDCSLSSIDLEELKKKDNEIAEAFITYSENHEDTKEELPLMYIMIFFVLGCLFLLSSFVIKIPGIK